MGSEPAWLALFYSFAARGPVDPILVPHQRGFAIYHARGRRRRQSNRSMAAKTAFLRRDWCLAGCSPGPAGFTFW